MNFYMKTHYFRVMINKALVSIDIIATALAYGCRSFSAIFKLSLLKLIENEFVPKPKKKKKYDTETHIFCFEMSEVKPFISIKKFTKNH